METTPHPPIFQRLLDQFTTSNGRTIITTVQSNGPDLWHRAWMPLDDVWWLQAYWRGFGYALLISEPARIARAIEQRKAAPAVKKLYILIHLDRTESISDKDIVSAIESAMPEGVVLDTVLTQSEEEIAHAEETTRG